MAEASRTRVILVFCVCSSAAAVYVWAKRRKIFRKHPKITKRMADNRVQRSQKKKIAQRTSNDAELRFRPIGHIQSCFPNRRGTPRQGFFTPSTRATLLLRRGLAPHALEGIHAYSHLWITFVFHANTQAQKRKQNAKGRVRLKIQPPKYDRRVGVLSTRSPHRPNPIGQTVVRLESVDLQNGLLHLSGIDFVDGTPVLDVKPYVPLYDSIPTATIPDWVCNAGNTSAVEVRWSPLARDQVNSTILSLMQFYSTKKEVVQVINEVLQQNMRSGGARSRRQRRGHNISEPSAQRFCFSFDGVDVKCVEHAQDSSGKRHITVESILASKA